MKPTILKKHTIAIYVPSTIGVNSIASHEMVEAWVRRCKVEFSRWFGGYTSYQASGGWYSDEVGLVEEDVVVVKAFIDDIDSETIAPVLGLADQIGRTMRQEYMCIEIDTTAVLRDPNRGEGL